MADIFFNIQIDCESTDPAFANPQLGKQAVLGFTELLEEENLKATFMVIPTDMQAHASIYRQLDAVANYWIVIPVVFCENRNIEMIREVLVKKLGYHRPKTIGLDVDKLVQRYHRGADVASFLTEDILIKETDTSSQRVFKNVDGIKFLKHEGGCGGTPQDSDALCALLAGYVNNANVAGATVLSLGCQHAQVKVFEEALKKINPSLDKPLYILGQLAGK